MAHPQPHVAVCVLCAALGTLICHERAAEAGEDEVEDDPQVPDVHRGREVLLELHLRASHQGGGSCPSSVSLEVLRP